MTAPEAQAEAYDQALHDARQKVAGAIMDRYVKDLPEFVDLTEEEIADAESNFAKVADRQAPHDLHAYGFPVEWCGACREERR